MNLPIAEVNSLVVQQKKEMLEVFTNLETKNCYAIQTTEGTEVMYAAERSQGAWAFIVASFLKNKRPFTIELTDETGEVQFTLRRPWTWFLSELHISDSKGNHIGSITQQFAFLSRQFVITDSEGAQLAKLHGPLFRPWTFRILEAEQEIGKISKQWSGLLKEAFTDADTFGVEFGHMMAPNLRPLVLGATFLIDFLYFENRG